MGDPNEYSLMLLGRFPGKDKAVAQAMARAFNRDESWGLQVVGASPITMITGLTQAQSQAVYANLMDVEQAGCRFQVQQGVDGSTPQIGWPEPPRIHGRTIAEMMSGGAPAPASISGSRAANVVEVTLPCPYTGKPLILKIALIAGESVSGVPQGAIPIAVPMPVGGAAPIPVPMMPQRKTPAGGNPVPVPIPVPRPGLANSGPRPVTTSPIPIPVPIPMPGNPGHSRSATAQVPKAAPMPPPRPRSASPGGGSPAIMPEDFEEIEAVDAINIAPPAPVARMPEQLPPPKPLPEVPMLDGQMRPLPAQLAGVDPRLSGPLDMSAFESALKTDGRPARASGIRAAVQLPAPKPSPEAGHPKAGAGHKGKGKA